MTFFVPSYTDTYWPYLLTNMSPEEPLKLGYYRHPLARLTHPINHEPCKRLKMC